MSVTKLTETEVNRNEDIRKDKQMTHYSKRVAVKLIGEQIKLPTEIHVTYCGLEVKPSKIDNENPECEDCQDWLIWDEIDNQGVHN